MSGTAAIEYIQDELTCPTPPSVSGFASASQTCWPGRTAARIDISGCNLHCPYCECPELLGARRPGIELSRVIGQLHSLRDRIGGVVVTGGEPTADPDLRAILSEIASLGLPLRLDTNGTFPAVLESLLDAQLLSYVAVDVKSTPERYDSVTRGTAVWERVARSINLVIDSEVDHEFRTTCYPSALHSADLPRIAQRLEGGRRYAIQQFRPRRTLDPAASSVRPFDADVLRKAAICCAAHIPTVLRGV